MFRGCDLRLKRAFTIINLLSIGMLYFIFKLKKKKTKKQEIFTQTSH